MNENSSVLKKTFCPFIKTDCCGAKCVFYEGKEVDKGKETICCTILHLKNISLSAINIERTLDSK